MVVFLCFRPLPTPFTLAFRLFPLTSYPIFFAILQAPFQLLTFLLPLPGLSVPLVMPLSSPSTPSTLSSVKVLISVPFCSHFHFLLLLFLFVSPFIPSPAPISSHFFNFWRPVSRFSFLGIFPFSFSFCPASCLSSPTSRPFCRASEL